MRSAAIPALFFFLAAGPLSGQQGPRSIDSVQPDPWAVPAVTTEENAQISTGEGVRPEDPVEPLSKTGAVTSILGGS